MFVGIGAADFAAKYVNDLEMLSPHSGLGSGSFAAANRISHVFGLTGPSFAVNTACASSLTALHLAVTSLQAGECDLAVVGGVNLLLHPSEFVALSQARVLSKAGRTRSFSSEADGYVRGEGCGVVVLRRQQDALAAGDRVAAVIRGSALSHVGASNGMSAPNGPAQESVMRAAAAKAGINPAEIEYLEAQGTGTELGDAIEMGAIRNVMTQKRPPDRPLRVGAVKSNMGNLEEASGMAGLIKTALALEHGIVPPTLHFGGFNQYIRIGSAPIRVVVEPESWERQPGARRIAAVSGFGYGGANAHVVLEDAAPVEPDFVEARPPYLITVSARTPSALRRLASLYADALSECAPEEVQRFCVSANTGRAELSQRLAVTGSDRETLASRLRKAADGDVAPEIHMSGRRGARKRALAFLFSDETALDAAAVSDLYRDEPAFREAIDRCAAVYDRRGEGALAELLIAPDAGALKRPQRAQPALFALQAGLANLWESWGVRPDVLLGVGLGEIAAATCAGVLSIEDGMAMAIERGALTERLAEPNPDASVFAAFDALIAGIDYGDSRHRLLMATENATAPKERLEWPEYWREHVRRSADVPAALKRLADTTCDIFLEIGPKATLAPLGRDSIGREALWLASLQTGSLSERAALVEAVAALYAAGRRVDFRAFHKGRGGAWAKVPLYPFERQRYWLGDIAGDTGEVGSIEALDAVP